MADDIRFRFAALLRERRPGLPAPLNTQEGLAEHLGVRQPAVSAWERGLSLPTIPLFLQLLDLLGVSPDDLTRDQVPAS